MSGMQTAERVASGRGWTVASATLLAGAWAALGFGLYLSPSDRQVWADLEGGGRFALGFAVYLPFLLLTVPILFVVLVGFFWTRTPRSVLVLVVATAFGIAVFAGWVANQPYLFDAQPWLRPFVVSCVFIDLLAALATVPGAQAAARM
ncbi:hypothetical protein [Cryptosporangium minutisporangium]|uniref:Uncharacterized protein n=1 Tax=Cryptosporangium minutisporangium TaxID=113569 RepID=A0ABP6T5M4_9ACTN